MSNPYPGGMSPEEFDALCDTVDPDAPCESPQGSEDRVLAYAARYRAGRPIYHPEDVDLESWGHGASPALKRAAIADFNPLTDAELCVDELEEPDDESDWE